MLVSFLLVYFFLCLLMLNTCQPLQQESTLPFKISVYHNVLARTKDSVADARFLGACSFKVQLIPNNVFF